MGFGISKFFIFMIIICIIISIATKNWINGIGIFAIYAGIKLVWNILTEK